MTKKTISELLEKAIVLWGITAIGKGELLDKLTEIAAHASGHPPRQIRGLIVDREALGSTGIGNGIAIPHTTIPNLPAPLILFATLAHPVDFDAIDEQQVDIVSLVLSPPGQHMSVLAGVTRLLRQDVVLADLRSSRNSNDIRRSLTNGASQDA